MTTAAPTTIEPQSRKSGSAFAGYAWGVLAYTVFVILFGAWVRITGSGAGCGDHWPSCQGEVVPRAPALQTIIEYTHRVTSGLLGPLCVVLSVWALRARMESRVRRLSLAVTGFVIIEGLIGALLVKRGLVAEDASLARAIVVGLHLGNTLLLTGSAALLGWISSGREARFSGRASDVTALCLALLVSMMGAVTALGDTLFPVALSEGSGVFGRVKDGLDVGSHFLIRLRAVHPIIATGLSLWLLWRTWSPVPGSHLGVQSWLQRVVWAQLVCGFVNVALSAPGWMQLVHLGLAQALWMTLLVSTVARAPGSVQG